MLQGLNQRTPITCAVPHGQAPCPATRQTLHQALRGKKRKALPCHQSSPWSDGRRKTANWHLREHLAQHLGTNTVHSKREFSTPLPLHQKNSFNRTTRLLPNISKPFSFPTHSSAAYLLPDCSAQGRQWPSNHAVLPRTWTLLSAHHSCACVFQKPLSSVASVELAYIFHLLFWLFGWLLFHSLNVGAPKNPAPLSSPHTRSQRQTHEPHSPLIPHAENTHLHTGPKSPSSSPDPHFLSAHEQLHLAVWNTSPVEHAYY